MEGVLYTCSLLLFLLISIVSTVNGSQGVFFSDDIDLFPFVFDKLSLAKDHGIAPPLASPSPAPAVSRNHDEHHHPMATPPKNDGLYSSIGAKKKGLNTGQMSGLVLVSIAGLLQVVVLAYLLVKRRQMLRVVEKYEV